MTLIDEKIREFGQKRDNEALQEYIKSLNYDELVNNIKLKINTANFLYTLDYMLKGFIESSDSRNKRFRVVNFILREIEDQDISTSCTSTIINRICLELSKFKSQHLAELCSFCLESIQSKKNSKMGWKDLLPELLNVLVDRDKFEYNDVEYTGLEYKTDLINTLCLAPWPPNIVTVLASIFIDMPLTKEEHLKLVNKLGSYMEKLVPQEIPAFVYQLLKLCKKENGRAIFLRLQNYFGLRIYNKNINTDSPDSNIDFDAIESASNQETVNAESTILFHIHSAASLGHDSIKDYLSSLKNMVKAPEFILHPFQLMVLFTISTIPHYEETVFEIIRPCIIRLFTEEDKLKNSCWFREMVTSQRKPEEIFSQVVYYSFQDRDLVLQALVNFGFVLLGIGATLGRDTIAERQWNLGNMILLKIIKRKRHVALTIIQTLTNHIVTRQNPTQYIECLYILSKTLPLLMLENQSCIVELMEDLVQIPGQTANQLLDALIPLVKVSPTIRDHLIILLRKALYSRVTVWVTRQMAVNGFLKLLTNIKITNMSALSDSSSSMGSFSSGHSLFTQISINKTVQSVGGNSFSNEALCLEVLSILKRCFMQSSEVRAQLYEGLYDSVCTNPELGIPVLDLIWFHFRNYYSMDEEVLPPLQFNKITVTKEADYILMEPLGKLICAVGLIVSKVSESEDKMDHETVLKFINVLNSLCNRMANCELVHFELDNETNLLDIIPESQQKLLIIKEVMSVYEALIGFKISSWNKDSEKHGQTIKNLFQGYIRLLQFTKKPSKPKKADGKKKKTTQQTQENTTLLKKDGQKSPKKKCSPETVLDFKTIKKTLSLLHEPSVPWTKPAQANILKERQDFHQHIMQATILLVNNVKKHKDIDGRCKKMYYDNLTEIAHILFKRIIERLDDFVDFDCTTAVLAVECFYNILVVVSGQYKSNFKNFLTKVGEDNETTDIVVKLTKFIRVYQKLLETDDGEISNDLGIKKITLTVVNTLSLLANQIPSDSNALSVQMSEWLKNIACNNTVPTRVSSAFMSLFFETHLKYKVSLVIIDKISVSIGGIIGVIEEEENTVEEFKIANEGTVYNILLCICDSLKFILEDVDILIARVKSEVIVLGSPGIENAERKKEDLQFKERGICCQLCFVINILTNVTNLSVQPGSCSEAIFKIVMSLFSTLSFLGKHFVARSTKVNLAFQGARFERLVKLAGKKLAPSVYRFISYMEESQKSKSQAATQSGKKRNVDSGVLKSKVLKETRLIPKVVYEIEQFSKCVIQLTNKTKVDLSKYVGQGTVRDFRIVGLNKILEKNATEADVTQTTQASDRTASDLEEQTIDNEENQNLLSDEDEIEATPPPPKKAKK